MKHWLQQAATIISGKPEQTCREGLESSEFFNELHSEVLLGSGVDDRGAAIAGKEGEELQPGRAALLLVVDDGLDPETIPEDAHHDSSHHLHIVRKDRDSIDEGYADT